jgi:hypothetical protein
MSADVLLAWWVGEVMTAGLRAMSANSVVVNLGGEGEVVGPLNQQGRWVLDPGWLSRRGGQTLSRLRQLENQFVISTNVSLPFADQSVGTVVTNSVPIDTSTWLGPGIQSSEVWRILQPDGSVGQ